VGGHARPSMKLTKELCHITCIHEAAHAVVFALGGVFVYSVEVAPEGAESWSSISRKGTHQDDLWGSCATSDVPGGLWLRWDNEEGCYTFDKGGFREFRKLLPRKAKALQTRAIRAFGCGFLAGPMAEMILDGQNDA